MTDHPACIQEVDFHTERNWWIYLEPRMQQQSPRSALWGAQVYLLSTEVMGFSLHPDRLFLFSPVAFTWVAMAQVMESGQGHGR